MLLQGVLIRRPWCITDVPWEQIYNAEPLEGIDNESKQKLVLGGEVCMWSETVDTSNVQQTIWPRAAAAAERLWSTKSAPKDTPQLLLLADHGFHRRLHLHLCRGSWLKSRKDEMTPIHLFWSDTQAGERPPTIETAGKNLQNLFFFLIVVKREK